MLLAALCARKAARGVCVARVVSDDGFWVVSTLHKERESVLASPFIKRGLGHTHRVQLRSGELTAI